MFRVSIIEGLHHRKLVLEGRLVQPWAAELEAAWKTAREQLQGRKLVVDLTNVTFISKDGEGMLIKMMKEGARFSCRAVLTKHVLKQLARKCRDPR